MNKPIRMICAIALLVWGCDEDTTDTTSEDLVGSWSLVQRICSLTNVPETPASLGHSVTLQLDANRQARVREGASLVTTTTYEVSGEGIFHEIKFGATTFFGSDDVQLVISNDDTLELQWQGAGFGCLATLTRIA